MTLDFVTFDSAIKVNLKVFKLFYWCFGVPLTFKNVSKARRLYWYLWFTALTLRGVYVSATLAYDLSYGSPSLLELTWHLLCYPSHVTTPPLAYFLLIKHIDDFGVLWRGLLVFKPEIKRRKLTHFFLYFFPSTLLFLGISGVNAINSWVPSLKTKFQFLVIYGRANGYLDNDFLYGVLTVATIILDWGTLYIVGGAVLIVFATQLTFFEIWNTLALALVRRVQMPKLARFGLWKAIKDMNRLTVLLRIFNMANSMAILWLKLDFISNSILCLSGLMLLEIENPVITFIYSYCFLACFLGYPALYAHGYSVRQNLVDFKDATKRHQNRWCVQDPTFLRQLDAISTTGVWIGSFRTFERDAIPIYLDFVFQQVVSIVLTYKS